MFQRYRNHDLGLALIRLGLAAVFIGYGWQKFQHFSQTVAFFGGVGLIPFWAYVVTAVELLGGIAMLLGIFTFEAGIALAIDMLVAIWLVTLGKGFLGGYDYNIVLLLTALGVAFIGPGRYVLGKRG